MKQQPPEFKNLMVALLLCTGILMVWHYTYEAPRQLQARHQYELQKKEQLKKEAAAKFTSTAEISALPREARLAGARVKIDSPTLHGSIGLKGLRFDDLALAKYRNTPDPDSAEVILLSPGGDELTYFAQVGWLAEDSITKVPDENSQWQASGSTLTPSTPVTFTWDNGQGITFEITASLDEHYMFTLDQQVKNHGAAPVKLLPYAFINRAYNTPDKKNLLLHDGPLGVLDGTLKEVHYKTLQEESKQTFNNATGWLGITDKYWLTALVPASGDSFTANFSHYESKGQHRYQVDYTGQPVTVAPGTAEKTDLHFFAGAKEIHVLDAYTQNLGIPLFDRAVDFGMLYFLTKPIFLLLTWFYALIGNFGIAILLLTVVIKAVMFPLASKSFHSMGQMKALQPEMKRLKELHGEDKMKMNQEIMALYKKEKVNPAAGCLPLVIQLPVFFALYKVLYVTIEMRHAPFYGWIRDLSAPDPTNIFDLFGLIPWHPTLILPILHVGIWPMIMCATMIIQQKLNPPPSDPVQAKVMGLMPYFFLFLFSSFPAGLVIYWSWSNSLSILQQWVITRNMKKKTEKAKN